MTSIGKLDRRARAAPAPRAARGRRGHRARPAVHREQLRPLRRDAGALPRVRRAGLERDDGIRRPALARAFPVRRPRRVRVGGPVLPLSASGRGRASGSRSSSAPAVGAFIGFLAFRLRVSGVQLSLLTVAFAELARIGFDHIDWLGGPGGLFLRVADRSRIDLLGFRGPPAMYYYAILALAAGALGLCSFLLRRRAGYYWRAIREDEVAAASLGIDVFRWKMRAVVLSSAMTAVAGVFFAFYYNSLFPEQIFSFGRSIEIVLGPVIGGVGTLFGPIVGAGRARAARRRDHRGPEPARVRRAGRQAGRPRSAAPARHDLHAERALAAARARARLRPEEALTWRCSRSRT